MTAYHEPVLLKESIEAMKILPNGIYVDATFGGGGHSKHILTQLGEGGKLIAFDQDSDAIQNLPDDDRIIFVQQNFRYLKKMLRVHGIKKVDGILADLGVSSHQFNEPSRGFSYRFEADLDMRMNQSDDIDAQAILNTYSEEELVTIFSQYGEVRNSKTLAKAIVSYRFQQNFQTIDDLLHVLNPLIRGKRNRYLAQVFQALRIAVNDEMGSLKDFLEDSLKVLKMEGRLVVLSYHSLEDRMVKNFIKKGNVEGEFIKNYYGHIYRPFTDVYKKGFDPTVEEVKRNPRAHSAKMRVGEKIAEAAEG